MNQCLKSTFDDVVELAKEGKGEQDLTFLNHRCRRWCGVGVTNLFRTVPMQLSTNEIEIPFFLNFSRIFCMSTLKML